jgi:hypothetical protein
MNHKILLVFWEMWREERNELGERKKWFRVVGAHQKKERDACLKTEKMCCRRFRSLFYFGDVFILFFAFSSSSSRTMCFRWPSCYFLVCRLYLSLQFFAIGAVMYYLIPLPVFGFHGMQHGEGGKRGRLCVVMTHLVIHGVLIILYCLLSIVILLPERSYDFAHFIMRISFCTFF